MPDAPLHARSWTLPAETWEAQWPHWPAESLLMAERADQVVLAYLRDAPAKDWKQGHLFTAAWHVRWRRLGAHVRVVLLGDLPEPAGWGAPDERLDLTNALEESRQLVLWGVRSANEDFWIELRMPYIMHEPLLHPAGPAAPGSAAYVRRRLEVITYRDAADGRLLLHRYTGLGYAATGEQGRELIPLDDPG